MCQYSLCQCSTSDRVAREARRGSLRLAAHPRRRVCARVHTPRVCSHRSRGPDYFLRERGLRDRCHNAGDKKIHRAGMPPRRAALSGNLIQRIPAAASRGNTRTTHTTAGPAAATSKARTALPRYADENTNMKHEITRCHLYTGSPPSHVTMRRRTRRERITAR